MSESDSDIGTEVVSEYSDDNTDYSDSDSNDSSDYEPDWAECNCKRVSSNGLCECKKEPAWELDSAGEIKSTTGTIDINVSLTFTKFHNAINTRPYFKSGKHLKLGDIVPTYSRGGVSDSVVVGWTKDDFITLPLEKKNGKYSAEERYFDSGDPEEIKGHIDIQPLLKQLADGIGKEFN